MAAIRQVKNQRLIMMTGLCIHTACIPALTNDSLSSVALCPHPLTLCELTACSVPAHVLAKQHIVCSCSLMQQRHESYIWRYIQSYGGSCLCALSQSADLAHSAVKGSGSKQRNVLSALVTHSLFHQHWRHLSRGIALRFPQPIMGSRYSGFTA